MIFQFTLAGGTSGVLVVTDGVVFGLAELNIVRQYVQINCLKYILI